MAIYGHMDYDQHVLGQYVHIWVQKIYEIEVYT